LLKDLHWLRVPERIYTYSYKLSVLVYTVCTVRRHAYHTRMSFSLSLKSLHDVDCAICHHLHLPHLSIHSIILST